MRQIKQSGTRPLSFLMIDSVDHRTGKTGLTPTVTISKDSAAFAAPAGSVAEIGSGWYKFTPTSADTNALGTLILHAEATGADDVDDRCQVVAFDPEDAAALGLSRLDATISSRGTSTYAGADTSGTTTLLSRITATVPTANDNAAALLDLADAVETGLTLRELCRGIAALFLGKSTGVNTTTPSYRAAVSDSKVRVSATADATGRSAVTTDLT